jgi:hypothetical protein
MARPLSDSIVFFDNASPEGWEVEGDGKVTLHIDSDSHKRWLKSPGLRVWEMSRKSAKYATCWKVGQCCRPHLSRAPIRIAERGPRDDKSVVPAAYGELRIPYLANHIRRLRRASALYRSKILGRSRSRHNKADRLRRTGLSTSPEIQGNSKPIEESRCSVQVWPTSLACFGGSCKLILSASFRRSSARAGLF